MAAEPEVVERWRETLNSYLLKMNCVLPCVGRHCGVWMHLTSEVLCL